MPYYIQLIKMRIWSIHPEYLDAKRLTAVWRETLLAKKVLENKTRGYKSHPQLIRFKQQTNPLIFINTYLYYILKEAEKRNYNFDKSKITQELTKKQISVTEKQLDYEIKHLQSKLNLPSTSPIMKSIINPKPHPVFKIIKGEVEDWEKMK